MFSAAYWALIDTLPWPIFHRRAIQQRSRSASSVHLPGSTVREQVEQHVSLLFSGLLTPSYTKYSVWNQLESSSVDFKLWTVFSYLIPGAAGHRSHPSKGSAAGGRGICEALGRQLKLSLSNVHMNTSTSTSRVEFEKLRLLQLSLTRQVTGCSRSGKDYLKGGRVQRS